MFGRIAFVGVVALGLFVYLSSPASKAGARVSITCSAPEAPAVSASFEWRAPKKGAVESWLDVSLAADFTPGWFESRGPFAPAETKASVESLPSAQKFYYRVNTLYPDGWHATASGTFESKCGAATPSAVQATPDPVSDLASGLAQDAVGYAVQENLRSPRR